MHPRPFPGTILVAAILVTLQGCQRYLGSSDRVGTEKTPPPSEPAIRAQSRDDARARTKAHPNARHASIFVEKIGNLAVPFHRSNVDHENPQEGFSGRLALRQDCLFLENHQEDALLVLWPNRDLNRLRAMLLHSAQDPQFQVEIGGNDSLPDARNKSKLASLLPCSFKKVLTAYSLEALK